MIGRVRSAATRIARAFASLFTRRRAAPRAQLPAGASASTGGPPPRRRTSKRTSPQPISQTRWFQRDVESAQHNAAAGDLSLAGRLYRALARDGYIQGLLGTRTGGLVRLPKRFSGDPEAVAYLEGREGKPGVFSTAFPASELKQLDQDGFVFGLGVGELLDVEGLPHPVFCRLDPEFVHYRWWEDAYYYQSTTALERIYPGDGRWILHLRGGRAEPWNKGIVWALGRAFVSKEHAFFLRDNWLGKLANAARAAIAPQGATEEQHQSFFQKVLAWGANTVFGLKPGWDVKLIESNGRGYEGYRQTIADSNSEFCVAISGSTPVVTGGTGFSNIEAPMRIRADLIQDDGDSLAETMNAQAIPHVLEGNVPIGCRASVAWDTRPAGSRKDEAEALSAAAKAIVDLRAAVREDGVPLDTKALLARFAVPVRGDMNGDGRTDTEAPVETGGAAPIELAEMRPTDEAAAALAARMTELGVDRCEHKRPNRCWLCGVERTRDVSIGADGAPVWGIAWRPIVSRQEAA